MFPRQIFKTLTTKLARSFSSSPSSSSSYIGIDIGTSNIRASVIDKDTVKVIASIPALYARQGRGMCLGSVANNISAIDPNTRISMFKPFIGRTFQDPVVQKRFKYLPSHIANAGKNPEEFPWLAGTDDVGLAEVLTFLVYKLILNVKNCTGELVSRAVVSMPASYGKDHIQMVVASGRVAGLVHQLGINEPMAAGIAYGLINKEAVFAVVDLGGGSFDASVLQVSGGHFNFLGPAKSDACLNGKDFDDALMDYLVSEFKRTDGIDLTGDEKAILMLGKAAEDAKIELSYAPQTEIVVPFITCNGTSHKHLNITLTRSKFESLVTSLIENTKNLCKSCLSDAGVSPGEIDEVLLVGGMSRVPKLQEAVTEIFGKRPSTGVNPDEAVVVGAAASVHVGLFPEDCWNDK